MKILKWNNATLLLLVVSVLNNVVLFTEVAMATEGKKPKPTYQTLLDVSILVGYVWADEERYGILVACCLPSLSLLFLTLYPNLFRFFFFFFFKKKEKFQ